MKLTINDKFMITTDQYNFILQKYSTIVNKKDKSERKDWTIEGYFPNLQHALQRILQEDIRDLDEANILMVLDTIKGVEKGFKIAVEEYQLQKDRVKEKEEKEEKEDER
jgi:hypothetical protein